MSPGAVDRLGDSVAYSLVHKSEFDRPGGAVAACRLPEDNARPEAHSIRGQCRL